MANTYVKIASVSVPLLGAANIEFSSIPSTYTDLVLVASVRDSAAAGFNDGSLTINSNSPASVHTFRYLLGSGSSASSGAVASQPHIQAWLENSATSTASTFANVQFYFPNYANTSYNKSVSIDSVAETNATTAYASFVAGIYASTNAITTLKLTPSSGTYVQYSTATLYGISKS
jgi:hypothetical protein